MDVECNAASSSSGLQSESMDFYAWYPVNNLGCPFEDPESNLAYENESNGLYYRNHHAEWYVTFRLRGIYNVESTTIPAPRVQTLGRASR